MFVVAMILSHGTSCCFGRALGSDARILFRTRCDTTSTVLSYLPLYRTRSQDISRRTRHRRVCVVKCHDELRSVNLYTRRKNPNFTWCCLKEREQNTVYIVRTALWLGGVACNTQVRMTQQTTRTNEGWYSSLPEVSSTALPT